MTPQRRRHRAWFGLLLTTLVGICSGCAEAEQGKSHLLRHALVTLSQAAGIAEANASGRAVRVELDESRNRIFYDVDIVDTINKTRRLRIDAETGKVLAGL